MGYNDSLSQAIVKLFDSERFYAEVIIGMKRFSDDKFPAIAGVCIKDHIELHVNSILFEQLTVEERVAVLKHECEHILRNHIGRSKEIAPEVYSGSDQIEDKILNQMKHQTINIAADCAINCNLPGLPKGGVYPKSFDLKDNETMEWYLENLKDNEKAKNLMEFESHSLWSESEGDKAILKEKVRQAVNKAAVRTRNAGKMTSEDELIVENFNSGNVVNWREQLKNFVARSIECKVEASKKKRNRRYGIMFPGDIKIEDLHIGVAIDTSGSVSDEALNQFIKEIANIAKYAKVTVVEADSEIKDSYVFNPKKIYKIKGRGGTAYKPAFDFFNKSKDIDAMIYFGDMDCYDTEDIQKPKYPVLWAIVGEQKPPANFGREIKIKV